ncbi:MAG TPA: L,D-transpeptidase family protein [Acidimicrobiales bacterium]|jgi:L,D-peptidoglycan transpeptidase YkuD (ErfK/YbiS/YcfS/YnhG family)|nr:L,D-transpeptidase family protein [Acidimicrobiales bacterium]
MKRLAATKNFTACVALVVVTGVYVTASTTRADAVIPGQVITVQAATPHSNVAVLRTWQLESNGRYVQVFGAFIAFVGESGVGPTREGLGKTPDGIFTLTQAFGNQPNNGTKLPYFRAGVDDWWDENPASPHYNRHVVSSLSPGGDSENLYDAGLAYSHAVVINYNMNPVVKGAGSGFFLHVSFGAPTEGCVALPENELSRVMRWLLPADHPVISIGVGTAPLALITTLS